MARTAEGWQLCQDPRSHVFQVRFTHEGRRRSFTTGERDPVPAASEAARIYVDVVSGRWSPGKTLSAQPGKPFNEVTALWFADIEPSIDPRTFALYRDIYMATHFAPFFRTMDRLTTVGAEDYVASRLRLVTRETLKKELSVLRRFSKWAHRRGYLSEMPEIETPGRCVVGHVQESSRKRTFLVFTAEEMESIISRLPEHVLSKRSGERFPVRARFWVAWESSLRPATLAKLSVPENYRRGAAALTITDETDKSRYGRELPLSVNARKALDSVCPAAGIIFGRHDFRTLLRPAARAAGIDAYRAGRISDYDFRHSRLTHLGRVTSNLSGVMYLAGHKQPATTARYMRPQKAAAEDVLQAAAGAGKPEFWLHSGCGGAAAERHPGASLKNRRPRTTRNHLGFRPVRGGGLEPPWLLTASTSIHSESRNLLTSRRKFTTHFLDGTAI
ncbi:MAG: tyrosine-type recombinase/integrase, partial [Polyangia bacterium]